MKKSDFSGRPDRKRKACFGETAPSPAADVAEGAVAGAGVAEDEERGGLAREAFEHVRTLGAVAARVQLKPFHEGAGIGKSVAAGQLNTEPRGDPQRGFGILGCRHL